MLKTTKDVLATIDHPDPELIKNVHDFIFTEFRDWMYEPTSLIYRFPGMGNFYFKRKRTDNEITRLINKEYSYKASEEKEKEKLEILQKISAEYNNYTTARKKHIIEKYGEENYKTYCVDMEQKKAVFREKNITRERSKLRRSSN